MSDGISIGTVNIGNTGGPVGIVNYNVSDNSSVDELERYLKLHQDDDSFEVICKVIEMRKKSFEKGSEEEKACSDLQKTIKEEGRKGFLAELQKYGEKVLSSLITAGLSEVVKNLIQGAINRI